MLNYKYQIHSYEYYNDVYNKNKTDQRSKRYYVTFFVLKFHKRPITPNHRISVLITNDYRYVERSNVKKKSRVRLSYIISVFKHPLLTSIALNVQRNLYWPNRKSDGFSAVVVKSDFPNVRDGWIKKNLIIFMSVSSEN